MTERLEIHDPLQFHGWPERVLCGNLDGCLQCGFGQDVVGQVDFVRPSRRDVLALWEDVTAAVPQAMPDGVPVIVLPAVSWPRVVGAFETL